MPPAADHALYTIRELLPDDWDQVARIYAQGIAGGQATFETKVPSRKDWDQTHLPFCRLAAVGENSLAGFAALSPVSRRAAYAGVAEVSVYVEQSHWGRGVGSLLLSRVVTCSEENGVWTLQSSTFPENPASIRMQEKQGFRKLGTRELIARQNGKWRDTVIMERRSKLFRDQV